MLSFSINFLLTINVMVALLIVLVVLMQRPKSEGLGAAFGGGMTENLFGAQTTNVLANFTRWLGAAFFLISLFLSVLTARQSTVRSSIQAEAIRASRANAAASPAVKALATPSASPSASPFAEKIPLMGAPAAGATPSLLPVPSIDGSSH